MRLLAVLALTVCACAPSPYAAGGVLRERDVDAASLRADGCLDLALGLRPASDPDDNALLVMRVGNRCMRPAPFDLGSIVIKGVDEVGTTHVLRLFDPNGEIAPLHVDPGVSGVEKVRVAGAGVPLREICFDVTRVLPRAGQPIPPVCFHATGASAWQVRS